MTTAIASCADPTLQLHPREIAAQAEFRAFLFGRPWIQRRGDPAPLDTGVRKRAQDILHWFLLNPGRPCSAEQFADLLWPDSDPDKALTNFNVSLHSLKRILEPSLPPRQDSSFIQRHANRVYTFSARGRWWTDVDDFNLAYSRGHEAEARDNLTSARFYFRRVASIGANRQLLEGDTHPWVGQQRRRIAVMCSHSLCRLMELDVALGDPEGALETAYCILSLDPLQEGAVRLVSRSLYDHGRRDLARQTLESYRRRLASQVGARPAPDLTELLRRASC